MSFNARLRSALVVLSVLVAISANAQAPSGAAPATASVPALRFGIVPMQGDPASRAVQGGPAVGNLTYHNGPVQHAQKVFTIFWNPTGPAFPPGYQTTINQFVQDLNGSSYYAIASQYSDTTSYIGTAVTFGGTWLDTTNAFPETALTGQDLLNEVGLAKAANGWTSDGNSYFQIYTPSGITSSTSGICGLHYFYAPEPFGQILFPNSGCFPGGPYPNNSTVDAAINISAHEIMETLTDPAFSSSLNAPSGWYFMDSGGEIGDECNFNFGSRAGDGSNVTLGGHKYIVQQLWSNAVSGCALSYTATNPLLTIDRPVNGSTIHQTFTVSGWAIDRDATSGTGIDQVAVWAFPGSGTAQFLGNASYGIARPDIGELFGSQFTNSGFSLTVSGTLAPGPYQIRAYGHSTVTTLFSVVTSTSVTVTPNQLMSLDSPAPGSTGRNPVTFSGWAIDRGASSGTGVDQVVVYAYPGGTGAPQLVGTASYGSARPDIGGLFGSQFTNSGFSLTTTITPGTYTFVAFAHSTVANAYNGVAAPNVTVQAAITAFVDIDAPAPNTMATRPFTVSGWAVDTAAPTGTGIDAIALWAYPVSGTTPLFVGFGSYGASRPDIGSLFGNARFTPSGYSVTVGTSSLAAGMYNLVVFGHSTVTSAYSVAGVVRVTVQ